MYNTDIKYIKNLLSNKNLPIVLVGSPGSGKSTVGKRVAQKLNMRFYDSDKIIEEKENMSVVDIYDIKGTEYFQKREKEVIEEIISYGKILLSTGSSAFLNDKLRKIIKTSCITIWLYANIDILEERISRRNTRPFFRPDNTRNLLEQIVHEHYPLYAEADIKVESHKSDMYYVVDSVITKLYQFLTINY